MTRNTLARLATPLLLGAAILFVPRHRPAPAPIALQGGEAPVPSDAVTYAAFQQALLPGAPGYDRGAVRARVTVLEFADFGCAYCARFAVETYPALAAEFVKPGLVRWRYVPFVLGMFPNGTEAAQAAECAADQGRDAFAKMHDRLYGLQDEWKGSGDAGGAFRQFARASGLDESRFAACYAGEAASRRIRASNELADRMAVRATPTFVINGRRVEGALPVEEFRAVLLDALRQTPRN